MSKGADGKSLFLTFKSLFVFVFVWFVLFYFALLVLPSGNPLLMKTFQNFYLLNAVDQS